MKNILYIIFTFLILSDAVYAGSMFDNDGNYSGNWKQMTNVSTSHYNPRYSPANYSDSAWRSGVKRQQSVNNATSYSDKKYLESSAVPFRYNTLDYTRLRKVSGGHGESYSARCHDIGDVSFCR